MLIRPLKFAKSTIRLRTYLTVKSSQRRSEWSDYAWGQVAMLQWYFNVRCPFQTFTPQPFLWSDATSHPSCVRQGLYDDVAQMLFELAGPRADRHRVGDFQP